MGKEEKIKGRQACAEYGEDGITKHKNIFGFFFTGNLGEIIFVFFSAIFYLLLAKEGG